MTVVDLPPCSDHVADPLGLGVPAATVSSGSNGFSSNCFITTANPNLSAKEPADIWKKMRGIELAMMFLVPLLFLYIRKIANRR